MALPGESDPQQKTQRECRESDPQLQETFALSKKGQTSFNQRVIHILFSIGIVQIRHELSPVKQVHSHKKRHIQQSPNEDTHTRTHTIKHPYVFSTTQTKGRIGRKDDLFLHHTHIQYFSIPVQQLVHGAPVNHTD